MTDNDIEVGWDAINTFKGIRDLDIPFQFLVSKQSLPDFRPIALGLFGIVEAKLNQFVFPMSITMTRTNVTTYFT